MKRYSFIGWLIATSIWLFASFLWSGGIHTALLIVSALTGISTILSFMSFLVDRERQKEEDIYNYFDEEEH